MKFTVEYIVHPEETGGYSVEFPWIPNCFTCGDTMEEVHRNAREIATDIIKHHFKEHPDAPLFRYEPWDWECAPGKTFELEVAVRAPSRPSRRLRRASAPVSAVPVC